MTELNFKGKKFVYNHHLAVPFRPLVPHEDNGIGPVALEEDVQLKYTVTTDLSCHLQGLDLCVVCRVRALSVPTCPIAFCMLTQSVGPLPKSFPIRCAMSVLIGPSFLGKSR